MKAATGLLVPALFLLLGIFAEPVGAQGCYPECQSNADCAECEKCLMYPMPPCDWTCINDNGKQCSSCACPSSDCKASGFGSCSGGGCTTCQGGECQDNNCNPSCPSGWVSYDPGCSKDVRDVTCQCCGNSLTCWDPCSPPPPPPPPGDPVCGNNIVESPPEDCDPPDGGGCPEGQYCGAECTCQGGPSCFPAGTLISMADGSYKNIEEIVPGDHVLSYDFLSDMVKPSRVTGIETPIRRGLYEINEGLISLTNEHPFYVRRISASTSFEGWASPEPVQTREEMPNFEIRQLMVGDMMMQQNGSWISITSIEYVDTTVQTYNLETDTGYCNYFAEGLLVHNKCPCACGCINLTRPITPTQDSPDDEEQIVGNSVVLDWSGLEVTSPPTPNPDWGEDQKDCTNEVNNCECIPGQSDPDSGRSFDVYFGMNGSPSLPNQYTECSGDNFDCDIDDSQLTKGSLEPGEVYYWAVRAVNYGPATPPNDGISCDRRGEWTPIRSFSVLVNPPVIESVEVLDNALATCRDQNDNMTGWTGQYDPESDTHNPIDVAITISDQDGYEDIHTVWLVIAPENDAFLEPNNCHEGVQNYLYAGIYTLALMSGVGIHSAVALEVPEYACQPNCFVPWNADAGVMETQCNAMAPACYWDDYQAGFWGPYGCSGCLRNWAAVPWDPENPYRKFDPTCQYPLQPYPPIPPVNGYGDFTGCHGCYFTTEHPEYVIENATYTTPDPETMVLTLRIRFTGSAGSSFDYGQMQLYARARTYGTLNQFSGYPQCAISQPCFTTDPSWTWNFDLTDPTGTLDGTPDDPDRYYFDGTASDQPIAEPRSSGLLSVSGLAEHIIESPPGSALYPLIDWEWDPADPIQKELEFVEMPEGGIQIQGGDRVIGGINVEDIACNTFHDEVNEVPGHEWIMTRLGFVYGYTGLRNPMSDDGTYWEGLDSYYTDVLDADEESLIPAGSLFLSSDWIGSTANHCSGTRWGGGWPSGLDWCSALYTDCNSLESGCNSGVTSWYEELYIRAENSEWSKGDPPRDIEVLNNGNQVEQFLLDNGGDSIGIYEGDDALELGLSDPMDCRRNKILFVPDRDIEVTPDFISAGDQCLFVVGPETSVTVLEGADNNGFAEVIEASFISDGTFIVNREVSGIRYDPLLIRGMVFADTVSLKRDLVLASNFVDPAELLIDQVEQLEEFREMLGSKHFSDFECGVVTDSRKCAGWVLP